MTEFTNVHHPEWVSEVAPCLLKGLSEDARTDARIKFSAALGLVKDWDGTHWSRVRVDYLCRVIDLALDAARPKSDTPGDWLSVEAACRQVQQVIQGNGDLEAARQSIWAEANRKGAEGEAIETASAATRPWLWSAADASKAAVRAASRAARAASRAVRAEAKLVERKDAEVAAREDQYRRLFDTLIAAIETEAAK